MTSTAGEIRSHFKSHINSLLDKTAEILSNEKSDGFIFDAGDVGYYFEDDQTYSFRPAHHSLTLRQFFLPPEALPDYVRVAVHGDLERPVSLLFLIRCRQLNL